MKVSDIAKLERFLPGLGDMLRYRRADLPHDLAAGLAVAAVALPVGVAYAQLAGFSAVVGLYSSILPLLVYFLLGTSRQLIVGPDAATCALIALTVAPMAAGDPAAYIALSMWLALIAGVFCILASFLKLGAMADFLSRPILVGFLNGVAISIALSQWGKLFGFTTEKRSVIPATLELFNKLGEAHLLTIAISVLAFVVLFRAPRYIKRLPAALVAMIITGAVVALFDLGSFGVVTLGKVPAGLPEFGLPDKALEVLGANLESLLAAAAGIALISFSSAMLTARSFAAKTSTTSMWIANLLRWAWRISPRHFPRVLPFPEQIHARQSVIRQGAVPGLPGFLPLQRWRWY